MPEITEEEIARAICVGNPDDCVFGTAGTHEPMVCHKRRWQEHAGQARAILALFAPILAEKERVEKILELTRASRNRWFASAMYEKNRALAAEAALASAREEERERCAALADSLDPNATDIAAAIRAQGE